MVDSSECAYCKLKKCRNSKLICMSCRKGVVNPELNGNSISDNLRAELMELCRVHKEKSVAKKCPGINDYLYQLELNLEEIEPIFYKWLSQHPEWLAMCVTDCYLVLKYGGVISLGLEGRATRTFATYAIITMKMVRNLYQSVDYMSHSLMYCENPKDLLAFKCTFVYREKSTTGKSSKTITLQKFYAGDNAMINKIVRFSEKVKDFVEIKNSIRNGLVGVNDLDDFGEIFATMTDDLKWLSSIAEAINVMKTEKVSALEAIRTSSLFCNGHCYFVPLVKALGFGSLHTPPNLNLDLIKQIEQQIPDYRRSFFLSNFQCAWAHFDGSIVHVGRTYYIE